MIPNQIKPVVEILQKITTTPCFSQFLGLLFSERLQSMTYLLNTLDPREIIHSISWSRLFVVVCLFDKLKQAYHTCFAASILREEIYCVLTSQETPLSVGRSFILIPSFLTGVTASPSRNSSSSSGARGGLMLGGLVKENNYDQSDDGVWDLWWPSTEDSTSYCRAHTCIHWCQVGLAVSRDLVQQKVWACAFSPMMWWCIWHICDIFQKIYHKIA